ncbi:unnamed protein product, partial [Didymodactylos carnosus]
DDELDIALYDAIRFDSVRFADLFVEYGANFENLKGIIDMDDMNEFYLNHRGKTKRIPCGKIEEPLKSNYYDMYVPGKDKKSIPGGFI